MYRLAVAKIKVVNATHEMFLSISTAEFGELRGPSEQLCANDLRSYFLQELTNSHAVDTILKLYEF